MDGTDATAAVLTRTRKAITFLLTKTHTEQLRIALSPVILGSIH
jgi:hypothetical protein